MPKYEPSHEEIARAESLMTDEQKALQEFEAYKKAMIAKIESDPGLKAAVEQARALREGAKEKLDSFLASGEPKNASAEKIAKLLPEGFSPDEYLFEWKKANHSFIRKLDRALGVAGDLGGFMSGYAEDLGLKVPDGLYGKLQKYSSQSVWNRNGTLKQDIDFEGIEKTPALEEISKTLRIIREAMIEVSGSPDIIFDLFTPEQKFIFVNKLKEKLPILYESIRLSISNFRKDQLSLPASEIQKELVGMIHHHIARGVARLRENIREDDKEGQTLCDEIYSQLKTFARDNSLKS